MKVHEYRKLHPDCAYCKHRIPPFEKCSATNKRMSKRTAKKCPCYCPEEWKYETDKKGGAE
jgi:hypothetical protein